MPHHAHHRITQDDKTAHPVSGFWMLFFSDAANVIILLGAILSLACFIATLIVTVAR